MAALELIDQGFDLIGFNPAKLFSFGSTCSSAQIKQRKKLEQAITRYLSARDIQRLINMANADIRPTASSLANFYMGGKDCKHKNVHPRDQQVLDRLPELIQQRAQEAQQAARASQPAAITAATSGPAFLANIPAWAWAFMAGAAIWVFGVKGKK